MIKSEPFGKTADGRKITLFTVTNRNRTELKVTDMGAVWVGMLVKDRNGDMRDVILGLESGEEYELRSGDALGAIVGRNCNRISGHRFVLDGKEYVLADNDCGNNLHSGPDMYFTRLWDAETVSDERGEGISFSLVSPDGDQGMPGNLNITVTYILTEDDSVEIEYRAVSDADTVVNMTNHAYFNLGGHDSGDIFDEKIMVEADGFTCGMNGTVTDGKIYPVCGTPLDFRKLKRVGDGIDSDFMNMKDKRGYDHNFCLNNSSGETEFAAKVVNERTGIAMDIFTDMPGLQIYTGNYINEKNKGKDGASYRPHCGTAYETQFYPDAVNHPEFPSPVLSAGEEYLKHTVYHLYTV